MKRREKLLLSVVFLLLFVAFARALSWHFLKGEADNAIAAEILTNTADKGRADSHIAASTLDMIFDSSLATRSDKEMSSFPLPKKTYADINFIRYHFVPIYYLLAPFKWLAPPQIVLGSALALAFLGLLLIFYAFLREGGLSVIQSLLFCILVSMHPAWGESLFGQFYVDRLFLFLGPLAIISLSSPKPYAWLTILSLLLCSLIVEKMAIISGVFVSAYGMLYWKTLGKRRAILTIAGGLAILIFALSIVKGFLHNEYYGHFLTKGHITGFMHRLITDKAFQSNVLIFSFYNLLPLVALGWIEWRATLLTLLIMGPNLFGDIGGAEKSGFLTHYHSTYFPILVWALAVLYRKALKGGGFLRTTCVLFFVAILIVGMKPVGLSDPSAKIRNLAWFQMKDLVLSTFDGKVSISEDTDLSKKIDSIIPQDSAVSVPEHFMLHAFKNRRLYYYPLGIDGVDYVILELDRSKTPPICRGFNSYLGHEMTLKIDNILKRRLAQAGFDLDHPQMLTESLAVFSRSPHATQGLKRASHRTVTPTTGGVSS